MEKTANKKTVIASGIRPTSNPHVGNYLGAMRQFIELQKNPDLERFYFIVDLHALTTPFDEKTLKDTCIEVAATYLALGVDPKKSTMFLQSQVPQHVELAWIFNCITPLGELYRMTQFKEKSEQHKESINMGLLDYPVLMAADILIYKGQEVPVGEDQVQHVELTRMIARKFNSRFGKVFPEPKPLLHKGTERIKSLVNPEKKMSKTGDEALLITDSPDEIKRKLKKAVTASDTNKEGLGKPNGVKNLFVLLESFGTMEQVEYFDGQYANGTIKYSELKDVLGNAIAEHFAEFREKRKKLLEKPDEIAEILAHGANKAIKHAQATMLEVKEKLGLL